MNRLRRVYYVLEDGLAWRPFNGSCVTHCPDGYEDALDENNVRFIPKILAIPFDLNSIRFNRWIRSVINMKEDLNVPFFF